VLFEISGRALEHETVGVCAEPAGHSLFSKIEPQIAEAGSCLGTTGHYILRGRYTTPFGGRSKKEAQ